MFPLSRRFLITNVLTVGDGGGGGIAFFHDSPPFIATPPETSTHTVGNAQDDGWPNEVDRNQIRRESRLGRGTRRGQRTCVVRRATAAEIATEKISCANGKRTEPSVCGRSRKSLGSRSCGHRRSCAYHISRRDGNPWFLRKPPDRGGGKRREIVQVPVPDAVTQRKDPGDVCNTKTDGAGRVCRHTEIARYFMWNNRLLLAAAAAAAVYLR